MNNTISSSAVLVDLSISVWTARKLDRAVSQEVDAAKNTKTRAGNYNKHLLAGSKELNEITNIAAAARLWHYSRTLPWSDSGTRLLPTAHFMEYKKELNKFTTEFNQAVDRFLSNYSTLVSAAAFTMGALFNRDEYPPVSEIASKFKLVFAVSPVPEAGDFRIDIGNHALKELASEYEDVYSKRLDSATKDLWQRVFDATKHLSERLGYTKDGKKTIFKESTIDAMHELISVLDGLNVTRDVRLDELKKGLEQAMSGVTAEDLRTDDYLRDKVKTSVDSLLDKFNI